VSVIDAAVTLPTLAFITAWQLEDAGALHPVFGTGHHYYLADEARAKLRAQTLEVLTERRLARRGVINPLLRDTMAIIARADLEYYSWSTFASGPEHAGSILTARRGSDAVRVIVGGDVVMLQPLTSGWLTDAFVETLPSVAGAPIRAVSVTQSLYDDPKGLGNRSPLAAAPDTIDVDYVAGLMAARRDAVHQLYAATRVDGERRRSSPITAVDLAAQGRIVTYLSDDANGDERINLAPGSTSKIVGLLEATSRSLG
jgi:EspG family